MDTPLRTYKLSRGGHGRWNLRDGNGQIRAILRGRREEVMREAERISMSYPRLFPTERNDP